MGELLTHCVLHAVDMGPDETDFGLKSAKGNRRAKESPHLCDRELQHKYGQVKWGT